MIKIQMNRIKLYCKVLCVFLLCVLSIGILLCACDVSPLDDAENSKNGQQDIESVNNPTEICIMGGDEDYVIVFPEKASDAIKSSVKQMAVLMKDNTGKAVEFHSDKITSNAEVSREILIGLTNRDESIGLVESVDAPGYVVSFVGDKLVILGSDDNYIQKAIDDLSRVWGVSGGAITVMSDLCLSLDDSANAYPMVNADGLFAFKIISSSKDEYSMALAQELASDIEAIMGSAAVVRVDSTVEAGDYEILIGETNRSLSKKAYEDISLFEYRILTEGTQIAIAAKTTDGYKKAVESVRNMFLLQIQNTYIGSPMLPKEINTYSFINERLKDFNGMPSGKLTGIYFTGDSYVCYHENTSLSDVENYIQSLVNDGYTLKKNYSLGENTYSLLSRNDATVYVSYLPMLNATRVYVEPMGTGVYPEADKAQTVSEPIATPAIWQLEVDTYDARANGGMSYVMQLEDGTFIVVDGGYRKRYERFTEDATNIYNLLMENKPASHEKPIIAGWFITHLHDDHYSAMVRFSELYANDVVVKAFYYNFPTANIENGDKSITFDNTKPIITAMNAFSGAVQYNKLHSGMTIGFAGAEISIICTFEDVHPTVITDINDTSTVFRVTLGGQRIMFLADASAAESMVMEQTIPASELKSDIVQFSHHGYDGASATIYRLIEAHTVLMPINIISFQPSYGKTVNMFKNIYEANIDANKYIFSAEHVKKFVVAGAGTTKLLLPYTPSGEKLLDFNKYYNDNLQSYRDKYYDGKDPEY